jgi:hypothetical protein
LADVASDRHAEGAEAVEVVQEVVEHFLPEVRRRALQRPQDERAVAQGHTGMLPVRVFLGQLGEGVELH